MGGVGVLQEIEDLADDALPCSTDGRDNHVHGASKYCQIGVPAWEALLSGVIGGVGLTDVPGAIIIDLYPPDRRSSRIILQITSTVFDKLVLCWNW